MSDDITHDLDLLGDWLDAKGYTEEAGLCTRAMDEINNLRAALKPFIKWAGEYHRWEDKTKINFIIKVGDLRRAAAALKEEADAKGND